MSETAITPMLDVSQFRATGSARSRRITVVPESASEVTGSTSTSDIYFAIPSGKLSMINGHNSYLMFDYKLTGTSTAAADTVLPINLSPANGSASSFIRGLETIIQSQSVEYIDNYNVWANIHNDFQPRNRAKGVQSILEGGDFNENTAFANASASTSLNANRPIKQGQPHTSGSWYRACIPVHSSVLGTLSHQALPAMDGIRLRLIFDTVSKAVFGATGTAYNIKNLRLQLDYLDIDPMVHQQLVQESGGVFKTHAMGVANYQGSQVDTQRNNSLLIPARFSAVKAMLMCWRNSADVGGSTATKNKTGSRFFPALDRYSWNIGGRQYPSNEISAKTDSGYSGAEPFMETVKVFGQLHSPNFDCVFNRKQYLSTASASDDSFVLGLDFEEYGGSTKVVSGLDTTSSNIYFQSTHDADLSAGAVIDTFVMYDLIIESDMVSGLVSYSK